MTQKKQQQAPSKITMLAPIALVLAVYSFLFYSPQQSQLRAAQTRLSKLLEGQHDTEHQASATWRDSSRLRGELRAIQSELAKLSESNDKLENDRRLLRLELETPFRPAATVKQLTSLMESHRMQVLATHLETSSTYRANEIVKPVVDLLVEKGTKAISSPSKLRGREVYEVKIRGRFQDLQSALKSLSVDLQHVVPLSLDMDSLELNSSETHQSQRVWTLTILV